MQALHQPIAAAIDMEITDIQIVELVPSPFNTRVIRTKDPSFLEFVESCRGGIHQPIIVREIPIEGDVIEYQIVAGHRRVKAAAIVGLEWIPAIVRELTDDEARELQILENLQREGLAPLDEAKAFFEAMTFHEGKMLDVQELAARLGKSPVYIHRRLTLLDAFQPVQDALRKNLIEVGHALELARLSETEQERLLYWLGVVVEAGVMVADDEDAEIAGDEIAEDTVGRPTAKSVVELRDFIRRTTLQILSDAAFDPTDAELVPEAGACGPCLKRTGSSPMLFSDVNGEDICTDRVCFDGKNKVHMVRRIAQAKASKAPLAQVTEEWNKKGPNIHYEHHVRVITDKPCKSAVAAIYIDGHEIGKEVQICFQPDCKTHRGSGFNRSASSTPDPKAKEKRKKLMADVRAEKEYRLALFKRLMSHPMPPVPTDLMVSYLAAFAISKIDSTKHDIVTETLGWPENALGWQSRSEDPIARFSLMTQAEAIRAALVALEAHELTVHDYDMGIKKEQIGLEKVAKLIGVDPEKVRASLAKPTPPKAPAKKAAKKAAKATPAAAAKPAAKKAAKKKAKR